MRPQAPRTEEAAGTTAAAASYDEMGGRGPKSAYCEAVMKFLLFCILLVLCWPVALAALVLYPLVWLLLLPFRVVGIAVGGVLELIKGIFFLPGRVLRGI